MEVPSAVLEKLVCERCSGYLSRGPVHLLENRKYRCGRCPWIEHEDEEEGIRVEAYEELAKLMTFPCRYKENGCTSKVAFLENERHEEACRYREYLCPVTESGRCDWTGLQKDVLGHCQQAHPAKVLPGNPCTFTYDITRPSLNNYVLFVFEVLFLIQSKVCTASRKIYHAVRLIDDPARASDFIFTLEIRNKQSATAVKYGNVAPRELLVLQEDTSVVTDIDGLLEMLGDFKDTTFTVTIESSGQGTGRSSTPDRVTPAGKTFDVTVECSECKTLTEPVYRGGWLCRKHAPEQDTCENRGRGCTYSDVDRKCQKHEWFYCQYGTLCGICWEKIPSTTLDAHWTQAHGDITHRAGTVLTVRAEIGAEWLIIECAFGRAVCGYRLYGCYRLLWLYTPIPCAQLYQYRCTVDLSHPDTGHTVTRTPAMLYNKQMDWFLYISQSDYDTCVHDKKVNIKINITKLDDPAQIIV